MTALQNLTVDYRQTPLAVEAAQPRFSWNLTADRRDCRQTAYQLRVLDKNACVWDSGRVESAEMLNLPYAGAALAAERRYDWTVTIWDERGETATASSFFETAPAGWGEAKWIGSDRLALSAHTLSVFQFAYTVQIPAGSTRAGFLFGGNDSRLMDRDKNIQGVQSGRDESYIRLVLDIGPAEAGGTAVFAAYRRGYAVEDESQPLHQVEIPTAIINAENCHEPHTVLVKEVFGEICVYIDGEANWINEGERRGPRPSSGWNLNPVGKGNNYICFPLLCDIGVAMEPGQEAVFSDLVVRNFRQPANALLEGWPKAICGGGSSITVRGGESGCVVLTDPSHDGMTMLRTEFRADKPVARARLYATARGIYELYLNGKKVGDEWFAPGLSQYNKTHFYQTYDVTEAVRGGANALGAYLAEGWWSGNITFAGENWNFFGDRQSLLCRLVLTYEDGSTEEIVSAPETWQFTTDGPVRAGSFFQGEIYDSAKEQPGWTEPGFAGNGWQPAREIPVTPENAFIGEVFSGPSRKRSVQNYDQWTLRPQPEEGVKTVKVLTAVGMSEPRPGVYIYDMGQNMAGVPEITLSGKAGQRLTLRFAEILYPDMEEYRANTGMLMLENIRAALAQDTIYLKEGHQTVRPTFTFHGYRYIEITGIDAPLPLEAVKGLSLSSVRVSADFECADAGINRLYQNVCWSLMDNFISIPTDCPQRNERMGWSGDISVFSRTATYMAECAPFLRKHMQALRDTQSAEGRFDDVAPVGGGFGGTLWGSAGITVAWEAYRQFGDLELLKEHFPAMCRYARFLNSKVDPETGLVEEGPLGDWLGPENEKNEPGFLWQCYYIYDLTLVLQVAALLGDGAAQAEFAPLRDAAKAAFARAYLDPASGETVFSSKDAAQGLGKGGRPAPFSRGPRPLPKESASGRYLMDTQTSYAVPLALGILDEAEAAKAKAYLRRAVERENTDDLGVVRPPFSLMTGFIGTALICPALSLADADADAWRLLRQRSYPSWLYPVDQGATTIWERLDSFTLDRGFGGNNSMNSFNHYSFGAVAFWMLARALGVARGEENGVWALEPTPDPDGAVAWARGCVKTTRGEFRSAWEIQPDGVDYCLTVPANTCVILRLPASEDAAVTESGAPADQAEGVTALGWAEGRKLFRLGSGEYRFHVAK